VTIGQILGGQIGSISNVLEQIALTSPFMHTHSQSANDFKGSNISGTNSSFFILRSLRSILFKGTGVL
jgi:hypothetical protein